MERIYYYIRTPDGKEFLHCDCKLIAKLEGVVIEETQLSAVSHKYAEFVGDIVVDETFLGS